MHRNVRDFVANHGSAFAIGAGTIAWNQIKTNLEHTVENAQKTVGSFISEPINAFVSETANDTLYSLREFFASFNPYASDDNEDNESTFSSDLSQGPSKRQKTEPPLHQFGQNTDTHKKAEGPILRAALEGKMSHSPPADEPAEMQGEVMEMPATGGSGGFSTGASGGGQQENGGMPMFPDGVFTGPNKTTKIFTKTFYLKIYANGLTEYIDSTTGARRVLGWQTVIPYQALSSYMTAEEYLSIIRDGSYGKIKWAGFQLEFQDIRTPFGTNVATVAEANGNLQFELQEFHGIERFMPFETVETDYSDSPNPITITPFNSFENWIKKLYGDQPFSQDETPRTKRQWPAEMYQRGLDMRPLWQFSPPADKKLTGTGTMLRPYNAHVTSLPFGKWVSRRVNTNTGKVTGVYFNKVYKPKNGIISAASSIYDVGSEHLNKDRFTRINQPIRMNDINSRNPVPYNDPSKPQYTSDWFPTTVQVVTSLIPILEPTVKITNITYDNVWTSDDGSYPTDAMVNCATNNDGTSSQYGFAVFPQQLPCTLPSFTPFHYKRGEDPEIPQPWRLHEIYNMVQKTFCNAVQTQSTSYMTDVTVNTAQVATGENDVVGYGYQNDINYYTRATLENYSVWTSRNQPPIHEMPSWMIGIVPKTTGPLSANDDIVNATATFLCKTAIEIEVEDHPCVTTNFAYDYTNERFMDPLVDKARSEGKLGTYLYGGKWRHNEKDVFIRENKNWALDYARAGKMGFYRYDNTDPTL